MGAMLLKLNLNSLILTEKLKMKRKAIQVKEAKLIQAEGTCTYIILTLSPCK